MHTHVECLTAFVNYTAAHIIMKINYNLYSAQYLILCMQYYVAHRKNDLLFIYYVRRNFILSILSRIIRCVLGSSWRICWKIVVSVFIVFYSNEMATCKQNVSQENISVTGQSLKVTQLSWPNIYDAAM